VGAFQHLTADFHGVDRALLRAEPVLAGLLVAAAGAAGLAATTAPIVRRLPPDGVTAVLLVDGCHITAHTMPARGLLLLDVLAAAGVDAPRAVEVFVRRLAATDVRRHAVERG
jgi:S-adenosylmethionine/arginine decarboxylase-like enzyme